MHFKMFQRLKERAIEQIQREVLTNPRRERFVVILGRRRTESQRRARVATTDARGARLNVSPLVNWTKQDLNTYRLRLAGQGDPLPTNKASGVIHMSGDVYAARSHPPASTTRLRLVPRQLHPDRRPRSALAGRADIPDHRKTWGWGADPLLKRAETEYLREYAVDESPPESGDMWPRAPADAKTRCSEVPREPRRAPVRAMS